MVGKHLSPNTSRSSDCRHKATINQFLAGTSDIAEIFILLSVFDGRDTRPLRIRRSVNMAGQIGIGKAPDHTYQTVKKLFMTVTINAD